MASRHLWLGPIGPRIQALVTYDVFPAISAKVRRLFYSPLGVLILAAFAALLCGLYLHTQGFALFGGLLLVIVLGVAWPRLSLLGLRGSVGFDSPRAVEGERTEVSTTLTNRLPWAAYGVAIEDGLHDASQQADADWHFGGIARAPAWRTIRCRWSFTPPRRGVYPLETPGLTTGFPFGLYTSRRTLSVQAPLLVWPRTYPVMPAPQLSVDQQIEGSFSPNKVGMSGDVLGVRPYRRGDSLRRIHWSQTARHDRLIVCEFQANARPMVQLILDADPRAHVGCGPDGSREWAIRVVASLARGWLEAGVEVGAAWNGACIKAAAGPGQVNLLLDGLARIPDETDVSLMEMLNLPGCRDFNAGLQIIVATDKAVENVVTSTWCDEHRRWVILAAQGFAGSRPTKPHRPRLPVQPWMLIDRPERVPSLLHFGSKEVRHDA